MTKGQSQVLSGFCPNPHCQKKLFFPDHEASVECSGCGQRHMQSSLQSLEKSPSNSGLSILEAVEDLLYQLRKIDAGRRKTLEQENYKINGLSNYLCTILSSLLTTHGMDKSSGKAKLLTEMGKAPTFDCGQLCDRSFLIDPAHLNISGFGRDRSGSSEYLRDTLNVIKLSNDNEERLVPIHADGDGHCLLHSVSRALVGWELFWHPLRVNLKQHFIQNLSKYKMQFHDFVDECEWEIIIEECDPEFSPSGSEPTGLRNIHIFGLANVLRRPIILLDSMEGIQSSGDYSAIFLPIFSTPAACKNKDGVLNTPLCIAWSSLGRNHFIPLVGVKGKKCPVLSRHMIQRAWGVSDVEIDKYVHFQNGHCQIGGEKGLQIGYVQRLVFAMNEVFKQNHSVCASLVADVYQHIFKANGLVFGVNLAVLLDKTKSSTETKQLFMCLSCHCLAFSQPLEDEMCLPGGELYDLAISCHKVLKDGQSYSFPIHDVIAKYNKSTNRLEPVKGSRKPSNCLYCAGLEFRLVTSDYQVLYQNGDRTQTKSSVCTCGYKHYWNGKEYDTAPRQVLVLMEWGGRTVKEVVPWFQNEEDPSLNSNVYQMAQDLVQKNFPGEFGSERLVQKVVDQILMQADNPTKFEELKTFVQNHNNVASSSSSQLGAVNDAMQSMNTPGGTTQEDAQQMEVSQDDEQGSGTWSMHQPSKAIITGRQTQSVHKEELNMSNAERQTKQRIEKNAAIQQKKSLARQNKVAPNSKSTTTASTSHKSTAVTTTSPSTPTGSATSQLPSSSSSSSSSSSNLKSTNSSAATTPPTESAPSVNMANKRIRLATSDGRNLTLDLPAQCTFAELQSLVHKTVGVPPQRQKIRHGFPPIELKPPSDDESNYRLPVQPGDRITLDILPDPSTSHENESTAGTAVANSVSQDHTFSTGGAGLDHQVRNVARSAWNSFASPSLSTSDELNEASDLVLKSLMDPLMTSGGDNLDRSLSALALTAALEQKELWAYVQRLPHLFSVDGLFYKQVERDMGLEHGKHCTLPLLPHKVFVYNGQDDRLELCLEPYGHFPIENKVESKAQSLLPTSHCRSKTSHTPFSGQGHSLRSVSSQEDRMPTDVPMSPKRHEARRLNTMCDPSIHQESIEEEDEEGDDNAMKTDDNTPSSASSVSSHLLRPDELTRHPPATNLHIPGPESKLIRRGPGYSELSPIPENSSEKTLQPEVQSEKLHQLVERIEQAVKSMGQEADKVAVEQILNHAIASNSIDSVPPGDNDNSNNFPNMPLSSNTSTIHSHLPASSGTSSLTLSSSQNEFNAKFLTSSTIITTLSETLTTSTSSLPDTVSFPSPSAILLSSSIMASGSSRSSSANSSHHGSDTEKDRESPMAGQGSEFPPIDPELDCIPSRSSSSSSLSSFREEGPMDMENGGVDRGEKSRIALYAEEVASSIMAMDDDYSPGSGVSVNGALGDGGVGDGVVAPPNCDDTNRGARRREEEMDSGDGVSSAVTKD